MPFSNNKIILFLFIAKFLICQVGIFFSKLYICFVLDSYKGLDVVILFWKTFLPLHGGDPFHVLIAMTFFLLLNSWSSVCSFVFVHGNLLCVFLFIFLFVFNVHVFLFVIIFLIFLLVASLFEWSSILPKFFFLSTNVNELPLCSSLCSSSCS
jgi:hypothetical protein